MSAGIFLSASGARVTFHAGVTDALKELGFRFDQWVGASGGSIQAVLAVSGCRGEIWFDENIPIARDHTVIRPPILKESLAYIFRDEFLRQHGGSLRLEEVNRKVSILTSERFFRATVFHQFKSLEDLQLKLLASSSVPFFTTFPILIEDRRYADGFFGYFYRRLDFLKLLHTDLRIAAFALPTPYKLGRQDDATYIFTIHNGKYNPFNIMHIRYDDAKRFYEDGYEQVMRSGIGQFAKVS